MDYIEKLDLQTDEVEEVENLEKHIITNSEPFSVDEYEGHDRDFLAVGDEYEDGFNQLNETNRLGINCNVSKEVKKLKSSLDNMNGLNNKRIDISNDVTDTQGNLNIANFAGQADGVYAPIGQIIHHYTDGTNVQIDNVGRGDILVLKNANNPHRRTDKPSDYVGEGNFLNCIEHKDNGLSKRVFQVDNKGNMYWFDSDDTINMGTNKPEDGKYCFAINSYQKNEKLILITNNYEYVLEITQKDNIIEINSIGQNKLKIKGTSDLILDSGNDIAIQKNPLICYDGSNYARPVLQLVGDGTNKPVNPPVGTMYWHTTYKMPIFYDGTTWVKADGTSL